MNHNILFLLPLLLTAQAVTAEEPIRERIEWADIWVTDADKADVPRVLLIGDSITRGYFGEVEKHLAGKAYCARLTTSKCVSDPSFVDEVQLLLKHYKFAVIHFNNGLHGWGYTEPQYRDGLVTTLDSIKKQTGDAKLIWATTTPVRVGSDLLKFNERTARVKVRNQLAAEIMKERDVLRSLLNAGVVTRPESDRVKAPSAASLRTASRAGVIETPKVCAKPRRVNACPGGTSPCMIWLRKLR